MGGRRSVKRRNQKIRNTENKKKFGGFNLFFKKKSQLPPQNPPPPQNLEDKSERYVTINPITINLDNFNLNGRKICVYKVNADGGFSVLENPDKSLFAPQSNNNGILGYYTYPDHLIGELIIKLDNDGKKNIFIEQHVHLNYREKVSSPYSFAR